MNIWGRVFALLICLLASGLSVASEKLPARIVVAMDDNYPPYVFRDSDGVLKGYLFDLWALWEKKTGIVVELKASDWGIAQQRLASGEADVLDTVFRTAAREKSMDFSPPYVICRCPYLCTRAYRA
jgi:ABC-type amino acid transport substrate-binding protein